MSPSSPYLSQNLILFTGFDLIDISLVLCQGNYLAFHIITIVCLFWAFILTPTNLTEYLIFLIKISSLINESQFSLSENSAWKLSRRAKITNNIFIRIILMKCHFIQPFVYATNVIQTKLNFCLQVCRNKITPPNKE